MTETEETERKRSIKLFIDVILLNRAPYFHRCNSVKQSTISGTAERFFGKKLVKAME